MTQCIWCTRIFKPREDESSNIYTLEHAGITICWDCSDHYDCAEVGFHDGKIKARFTQDKRFTTEHGMELPIQVLEERRGMLNQKIRVRDTYGHYWLGKMSNNIVTFKPIGVKSMSLK